jgi:hypothetical protein
MAIPKRIRLSPSGPFISDLTGGDLEIGPGSTGLIWRGQGTDPAHAYVQVPTGGLAPLADITQVWDIPIGFHYDVQVRLYLLAPLGVEVAAQGPAMFTIEALINGVWTPIQNHSAVGGIPWHYNVTVDEAEDAQNMIACFQNVDWNMVAAAFPATSIRVQGNAPDTHLGYLPQQSMVRIEQYVV